MAQTSSGTSKQCPKCGTQVSDLLRVDPGLRLRIQEVLGAETLPEEICPSCYKTLNQSVSRGAKLRAEQSAREQNKLILWKSRVNLVKQGRALMAQKSYSEAAVAFEKYLRVLEVVHDLKPGELTPETFKDSARTKEITVVASVLWDLVRIYDTTPRYGDRQKKAARKLTDFVKLSPIQSEIVRKARQFEGQAKNPGVVKDFIKTADKKGGKCFIATATFQDSEAYEVLLLREFRDVILSKTFFGKVFISLYYFFSPPLAEIVSSSSTLQKLLRAPLATVALRLAKRFNLQTPKDV